ncbi:MAG TPA: helix-turn-helix domain-containing protein [Longimicrobiaceae bacterium]|nr:helix-turn-helix domain-containing protein [Longimicrobiaceae bacterium]
MSATDLLRLLHELPPDASLPARFILGHLEDEIDPDAELVDLTVEDVARLMGKAPSTVRTWLASGALVGYKFRGAEWRIRRSDLRAFQDGEAEDRGCAPAPRLRRAEGDSSATVDLGGWREERRCT